MYFWMACHEWNTISWPCVMLTSIWESRSAGTHPVLLSSMSRIIVQIFYRDRMSCRNKIYRLVCNSVKCTLEGVCCKIVDVCVCVNRNWRPTSRTRTRTQSGVGLQTCCRHGNGSVIGARGRSHAEFYLSLNPSWGSERRKESETSASCFCSATKVSVSLTPSHPLRAVK